MEFIPTECSHVENTFVPILVGACDLCVDTILRRYMDQVTRHCPECGGNFTIVLSGICHRCGYDMKLCMDICNRKPSCRCYQEQRGYYEDGKPVFDCLPDFL